MGFLQRIPVALLLLGAPAGAIAETLPGQPVTVVTHVDVFPAYAAQTLPLLEQFTTASRSDPGVKSFTLITWSTYTNHFQLIEVYDSLASFNAHVAAAHTVAFRTALQPYVGGPYDERLYTPSVAPF